MEDKQMTLLESLLQRTEDYARTSIELYKLKAIDKSANIGSSIGFRFTIFITILCVFLIINIGLALWIGEVMGKSYYGFFVIGGLYALLSILIYVFRDQWIKTPISNAIITQALK